MKRYKKSFVSIEFNYSFDSEGINIQGDGKQWRYRWENILYINYKNNDITIHTSKLHAFRISLNNLSEAQFRWIMSTNTTGNKIITPFIKKMSRRYTIIRISIVSVLILLSGYYLFGMVKETAIENAEIQKDIPPQEYLDLFSPAYRNEVKTRLNYFYKTKNDISLFFIDNNCKLLVYKIGNFGDTPLKNLVKMKTINDNIDISLFKNKVHYYQIPYVWQETNYDIYRSNDSSPMTSIFAISNGDSLVASVSNDSIVCYNLRLNNFLMRYRENGEIDFVVAIREFYKKQSFNVMFLKKKDEVYLLMMSPVNKNASLQKDALYDLINK